MSTRCQIKIIREDNTELNLYHHWDGYFSGVGAELKDELNSLKSDGKLNSAELIINLLDKYDDAYEVTHFNHEDIDFYYVLDFTTERFVGYHVKATKENGYNPWNGNACMVEEDSEKNILEIE